MNEAATYINDRLITDTDPDFRPSWMIVAQWDKVHPHPHGGPADEREGISEEYLSRVGFGQLAWDWVHLALPLALAAVDKLNWVLLGNG